MMYVFLSLAKAGVYSEITYLAYATCCTVFAEYHPWLGLPVLQQQSYTASISVPIKKVMVLVLFEDSSR